MEKNVKQVPAGRKTSEQVYREYSTLIDIPHLKELLDALPYLSAILNEERQAIYVNQNILDFLGIKNIYEIIGGRPGEILSCINSSNESGGCGSSENCRYCGANNSILRTQLSHSKIVEECRISSIIDGKRVNFDLQVITTPAELDGKNYTVLTLNDISSQKRKEVLEKVFFHDILNLSHNLQGFVELVQDLKDPEEIRSFLDQISNMIVQMNDEIHSQRELLSAEKGDLAVDLSSFKLKDFLPEVVRAVSHHNSAIGKEIVLNPIQEDIVIQTDKTLLTRVIVNMIKNACEAEKIGGIVYLNSKLKQGNIHISVSNSTEIPEDVKLQIFQRSFSTKGLGRGIGTYSMKLFGDNYLKGAISFTSNKFQGTTFTLKLPVRYPVEI